MGSFVVTDPGAATTWKAGNYYLLKYEAIGTTTNVNIYLDLSGVHVETIAADVYPVGYYGYKLPADVAAGTYTIYIETTDLVSNGRSSAFLVVAHQAIEDLGPLNEINTAIIAEAKVGIDLHFTQWSPYPASTAWIRAAWYGPEIIQMFSNGQPVTRVWSQADLLAAAVDSYWEDNILHMLWVNLLGSCPAAISVTNGDMSAWTFLTNTPYYWYTMDNIVGAGLVDEKGHTNGTISGATAIPGIIANCLDFDGINDYVDMEWEVAAKPYFTISFWLKVNTWTNGKYIFGQLDASGYSGCRIYLSGTNSIALSVTNAANTTKTSTSTVAINNGAWHHIIASYTGANVSIKVDHTWSTPTAQTGNTKTTALHAFMGACNNNGVTDNYCDCCIDQFRFFNAVSGLAEQQRLLEEPQMPDGCPDNWTSEVNHASTGLVHNNGGMLRFEMVADDTNCNAIISPKITLKPNQRYLLKFDYIMSVAAKLAQYQIRIYSGSTILYWDGTGFVTTSTWNDIANVTVLTTLSIDFTTDVSYTDYYLVLRNKPGSSANCTIDFDDFETEETCSPQHVSLLGLTYVCFCNGQYDDWILDFIPDGSTRNQYYNPFIKSSNVPALTQKIDDFYRSALSIGFGDLVLLNNGWFWSNNGVYDWHNKDIAIKLGKRGCDYDDFVTVYVGRSRQPTVNDKTATIQIRDPRTGDLLSIPEERFDTTTYPNLDTKQVNKPIPILFGEKTNITPVKIDTTIWKYKISNTVWNGVTYPLNAINDVYQAGVALTVAVDYTIDLNNGEFTLNADPGNDAITCDAEGICCEYDTTTEAFTGNYSQNVADILAFLLIILNRVDVAHIDLVSLAALKTKRTQLIGLYISKLTKTVDVIRILQSSCVFHFIPDVEGNYIFRYYDRVTPAGTPSLNDGDFNNFTMVEDTDTAYGTVVILYDQDPTTQNYKELTYSSDDTKYLHEIENTLEIETALTYESEATALAEFFGALLEDPGKKITGTFQSPMVNKIPSDKIVVSREIIDGNNLPVTILTERVYVIMEMRKSMNSLKSEFVALLDSQAGGSPSHANVAHTDDHGDTPYVDHSDTHTDAAHADSHGDVIAHSDNIGSHSDTPHSDSHLNEAHADHTDGHMDTHLDSYSDHLDEIWHNDQHQNTHYDQTTHSDTIHLDSHANIAHNDSHTDTHTNIAHTDTHADGHGDSYADHSDGPYIDWYTDIAHQDSET